MNQEKPTLVQNGWPMLFIGLLTLPLGVGIFLLAGLFTLQPNQACVLILFGHYLGTVRTTGLAWANPFARRVKVSLRARTLHVDTLKVNDKRGNPIEIGAVVVWHVQDTAQALFDVENYDAFIEMQSGSALRHLANSYPYDHGQDEIEEKTLRGDPEAIADVFKRELQDRVAKAGLIIDETRLTHLAYAPEIAQVMLRRQQAEAVIAARTKIVTGAVTMVELALRELSRRQVVELDGERKAAMVSNLLVILCGESDAQPVINAGTLYQ
jgi:regulator of protease activity HflC (stomatin/prohibitin superfamily)